MNIQFVSTLAWVFGVASTLLLILRIVGLTTYDEIDEVRDMLKGRVVTFPVFWPAVTATVCWAWLIMA